MSRQDCDHIRELLPAYSLGATTPEESARVEALLPDCPEAVDELTDYLLLVDDLRESNANDDTHTQHAASHTTHTTHTTTSTPPVNGHHRTTPKTDERGVPAWRQKLEAAHDQHTREQESASPESPQTTPYALWTSVAGTILVLLTVGLTSWYWSSSIRELQQGQAELVEALNNQRTESLVAGETVNRRLMATDDGVPESHAIITWDPETAIGSLYAVGLPELDDAHNYHVWAVDGEMTTRLGRFSVNEAGEGVLLFQSETPLESYEAIGINVEPLTARANPSTPHVIIGEI